MKKQSTPPVFGQIMEYPLTITNILRHANKHSSDRGVRTRTASGQDHSYSYRDLYKRVCQLAGALKRLGVENGDRVGTFAWNTHEHLELYYAIPCIGSIVHTLNIRLSPEQVVYIVNHAEDRIIFVDASLIPLFEKIAPELKTVEKFVIMGVPQGDTSISTKTTLSPVLLYEDLLAKETEEFDWPQIDERSAAALCYTSGTTGNPKGALYSHRSQFLHALTIPNGNVLSLRENDSILTVVPMFHVNAWGIPYAALLLGANIFLPGPHLKPENLAQMLQDWKVTLAAGVPTLWFGLYHLLKTKSFDLSHLRALIVGGAAMPRSMIEAFESELHIPILHAWGMTELSPVGTSAGLLEGRDDLTPQQRFDFKATQGKSVPCIEMRIVDDEQKILPWDGIACGELQVRGPWVISSYYKDPSGNQQFSKDGWFATGDVATVSPDGRMTITDRSKDLIKSGGEWISSVALENVLISHPSVLEAAVIAIPNEKWGERPLALIIPKNIPPTQEELINLILNNKFSKLSVPERFEIVSEIPKTSVGKIDKKLLRKNFS